MDRWCNQDKRNANEDCYDGLGLAPTIMNRFNGYRICGKRAAYNAITTTHPELIPDEEKEEGSIRRYRCPKGFSACNNDFFYDVENGQNYVTCLSDDLFTSKEQCPITKISLNSEAIG